MCKKLLLSIGLINFIWLTSCSQNPPNYVEIRTVEEAPVKASYSTAHDYGGWYCPDNIGFPAVNIQALEEVPVVNGRLPTKEETRNGTSLMYFDTTLLKNVRPMDMTMPRVARYYNEHTKKNEVIIVIQATIIEQDTVVGFRYLNGGNGSAWFGEIDLMTDSEVEALGSTPFVTLTSEINASKDKVWNIITNPIYAASLGELFSESDSKGIVKNAKIEYKYAPESSYNKGNVTADWKPVYLQIDYNFDGKHYVQKFFIFGSNGSETIELHLTSGPYGDDFEAQKVIWEAWLKKVKAFSEGL